jgi:hypothetical protein
MFCVSCGQSVKEEWAHCIACGEELEILDEVEDEEEDDDFDDELDEDDEDSVYDYNCPEQDAREFLNAMEFDHWRAAGMPTLKFKGDNPIGIKFNPESDEWLNYLRFALHVLEEDGFESWFKDGAGLLAEEFTYEDDVIVLTPHQVDQEIADLERDVWEQIGRPQMRRAPDGTWHYSSGLSFYKAAQITHSISDEQLNSLLKRISGN